MVEPGYRPARDQVEAGSLCHAERPTGKERRGQRSREAVRIGRGMAKHVLKQCPWRIVRVRPLRIQGVCPELERTVSGVRRVGVERQRARIDDEAHRSCETGIARQQGHVDGRATLIDDVCRTELQRVVQPHRALSERKLHESAADCRADRQEVIRPARQIATKLPIRASERTAVRADRKL